MMTRAAVVLAALAVGLTGCATSEPTTQEPTPSTATTAVPSPTPSAPASPTTAPPAKDPSVKLSQDELDSRLLDAAWKNDVAEARRLIDAGADVNALDDTVQSAYLVATSEGYLRLLELTLARGADVESLDSFDGTGLIRAAERGHADIVGRLVQAGISLDHVNNLGWVALHEALVFAKAERAADYVDTVRVLVAAGADVTVPSARDGVSPLQHARSRGLDAQAGLLRRAADAERVPRAQANARLLRAAEKGDPDAAALALRAGADLETRNDRQQTPLLLASAGDRTAVARLLVNLGADPDALDYRHDTPWLVTGVTGSVEMLEILLPARPDLTIKNRFGGLSPIPASERGHVDYVRRVVRTGVDLDHVNDLGWTALLEAVILGDGSRPYQQIVRTLIDAGVDTSIGDRDGRTALDHARSRGFDVIARDLAAAAR
ncbi:MULTISPECIES: ankyrin repeat domain-containing protein [Mumia]|uniref:Ankyrin repeat domain-containing protein n=2 Tax=Mumia TaxID=1546255 RepID=A0ABW1QI18_9ACTN|nr:MULTISPECIES: ankyrin repeat domain-containing protein [Mumia]